MAAARCASSWALNFATHHHPFATDMVGNTQTSNGGPAHRARWPLLVELRVERERGHGENRSLSRERAYKCTIVRARNVCEVAVGLGHSKFTAS